MRQRMLLIGLAAVLAGSCAPSINVEQERSALLQRDRDWSAGARDADRFLSFIATDGSVYPPGMPVVTGTEAIRKMYTEMSAAPGFSLQWTPAKAEVGAGGDLGYTTGTYEFAAGGLTERGKYVTTWKKQAGEWKVTEDIFNPSGPPPTQHVMVPPDGLTWGDPPPGLPAGGKVAVVSGDPSQPQPFVLRAQFPAGYKVPPHWHPTAENLTVLSGTVALGMGETADAAMTELAAGGYVVLPAEMRHSFLAKTAATIQIHGVGPFAITYVNPADDPRQKK
jgi:ketosteroid isomerase-like protein/quercetin dioxygenase-like cupin family protein